jgi:hypothetical protein
LLTLSEQSLPPNNERLHQIIRFMSTMRQQILTMARRVQERPCWSHIDFLSNDELLEHSVSKLVEFCLNRPCSIQVLSSSDDTLSRNKDDIDEHDDKLSDDQHSIYRQTSIFDIGHFKYYLDDHVKIQFSNGYVLHMTSEQVQFCQVRLSTVRSFTFEYSPLTRSLE